MGAGKNEELYNFYTDDCKVMAPGEEIVTGKEGIEISHAFNINVNYIHTRGQF